MMHEVSVKCLKKEIKNRYLGILQNKQLEVFLKKFLMKIPNNEIN